MLYPLSTPGDPLVKFTDTLTGHSSVAKLPDVLFQVI